MPTVIIDQSETAAQIAAMTFTAGTTLVVQSDSGTTPSGPINVNFTSLTAAMFANITAITVNAGATAVLGNALVGTTSPALTVNGGTIEVDATAAGTYNTINVGSAGGVLRIDNPGANFTLTVPVAGAIPSNFEIDLPNTGGGVVAGSYSSTTGKTTINDTLLGLAGRVVTITGNPFNLTANPTNYTTSDGSGGVLVCFLAGALIMTPRGEVLVEQLRAGDEVTTLEGGVPAARRLVWVGSQTVTSAADPDAMPIRIRRGALADGVPHADLLVTPEHCLLLGGRLVPARMLVNGRSIVIETGLDDFVVYHVETEPHAIILANGAKTESYLDTGNRAAMRAGNGVVLRFPTTAKTWALDAAAPLGVERDFVEPLWQAINARADAAGLAAAPGLPTTQDADIALLTATGRRIAPLYVKHDKAVFLVPGTLAEARLLSRTARPSDIVGSFLDDRRKLGLLVGSVSVSGTGWLRTAQTHLSAENLPGWYGSETAEARWTDGDAVLPLIPDAACATLLVEIEILGGGPYPLSPEPQARRPAIAA